MDNMKTLNFGVVGNCRSGALISEKGNIDWMCLPVFDSSSVFAQILDKTKGGSFQIEPKNVQNIKQSYIPRTNILATRFTCENGVFEIQDFMPRYRQQDNGNYYIPPDIIRYFKHISGTPEFIIHYNPQLEYAKHPTQNKIEDRYIKSVTKKGTYDSLYLYSSFNLKSILNAENIVLTKDEFCLVSYNQKLLPQDVRRAKLKLERTKVYWLNWTERTTSYKKYEDEIIRSALTLKMLSFDKSGAILAALTTSLPESIGEERNWDYRFCWIRDASMVVKIMTSLGHFRMAKRYLNFIIDILPEKDEKIQIMYGIKRNSQNTN